MCIYLHVSGILNQLKEQYSIRYTFVDGQTDRQTAWRNRDLRSIAGK